MQREFSIMAAVGFAGHLVSTDPKSCYMKNQEGGNTFSQHCISKYIRAY